MLFDVEADHGTRIIAYVVPDSGAATPSVRLHGNGIELLTLAANERRENLIAAGRHSTGQCGFVIDETLVPGLAEYADLAITETSHDVLVYRRPPPRVLDAAVFRLETHLLPLWRLDQALDPRFHYGCHGVERFGRETSTQVFCLKTPSKYVSGRLLFKTFEYQLIKGIKTIGLLRDPYHELAERLLLLKGLGPDAEAILGARDAMTFAPVIAALRDVDLAEDVACRRFFRKASVETWMALSNPLVRQLTTTTPDEMPGTSAVAMALDALASFEILGIRSDATSFSAAVADLVEMDAAALPALGDYPKVRAFGDRLRTIQGIEDVIEKDLEVFQLVAQAFETTQAFETAQT